jgi:hypothetical protein
MKIVIKNKLDYILVLLIILISANPYVSYHNVIFLIIIFIFLLIRMRNKLIQLFEINSKNSLIILFIFIYEIVQATIFANYRLLNIFRITLTMYVGYMIIKVINYKFIKIYSNIIFYLALISLLMYPLMYTNIGPSLMRIARSVFYMPLSELGYDAPTLIFYSFDASFYNYSQEIYRNAGFAWEAGSFAIYVNIALVFKLFFDTQLKPFLNKYTIVYITSIVTTFSTTGYLVLFLIILTYLWGSPKNKISKWVFLLLFIPASVYIFQRTDFLQDKITNQYKVANESQNRFGSAILDLNDVMKRPFFGWSRDPNILFGKTVTIDSHRPNGITNLLRSYGFIYFILFFSLVTVSFYRLGKLTFFKNPSFFSIFFLLVILISAFSQLVFDNMLFKSMVFWGDFMLLNFISKSNYYQYLSSGNSTFRINFKF